jgi:hypothetical protein
LKKIFLIRARADFNQSSPLLRAESAFVPASADDALALGKRMKSATTEPADVIPPEQRPLRAGKFSSTALIGDCGLIFIAQNLLCFYQSQLNQFKYSSMSQSSIE